MAQEGWKTDSSKLRRKFRQWYIYWKHLVCWLCWRVREHSQWLHWSTSTFSKSSAHSHLEQVLVIKWYLDMAVKKLKPIKTSFKPRTEFKIYDLKGKYWIWNFQIHSSTKWEWESLKTRRKKNIQRIRQMDQF